MYRIIAGFLGFLLTVSIARADEPPAVVVSIKPIHSLVSAVMDGVGEPTLLLQGHASPHTYALKPSEARMLENAAIVFRVGPELESFLNKPLASLGGKARIVDLAEIKTLVTLEVRAGGSFDEHNDDEHNDDEHHDDEHHDDEHHDDDQHEDEHHDDEEDDSDSDDHDHKPGAIDMHLWLDPQNAEAMASHIAKVLGQADPANAARFEKNADALKTRLSSLSATINAELKPVRDLPFLVFHDAYHYFENRFGLEVSGSILVNPQTPPGAETIAELGAMVTEHNIRCAFVEPQFSPRIAHAIAGASKLKIDELDPLGTEIKAGPGHYEAMMLEMARSFKTCLGG